MATDACIYELAANYRLYMENSTILRLLEKQRDNIFNRLKKTSISGLYKKEYTEIIEGKVFVFDDDGQLQNDLKKLSEDKSLDALLQNKLNEFLYLDNAPIILHFQNELEKVFDQIAISEKQHEIQGLFFEYDYYYHYTASIFCYGIQEYPIIDKPRYISKEFDFNKRVLSIDKGINFEPAWLDCEQLSNLNYLEIGTKVEKLFQLNSRVLLHKALDNLRLEKKLVLFDKYPISFYINEHDSEVMLLYRLT